MSKQPLGVTLKSISGLNPIGVYEAPGGVSVFETDSAYVLHGGLSVQAPVPVFVSSEPVFVDAAGCLQSCVPVSGLTTPPVDGVTWDANTTWDSGTFWS